MRYAHTEMAQGGAAHLVSGALGGQAKQQSIAQTLT